VKIAVIYSGDLPNTYANSVNTLKHAGTFAELGHDVTVFFISKKQNAKVSDLAKFYDINPYVQFVSFIENFLFSGGGNIWNLLQTILDTITNHRIRYIYDAEKKIANHILKNDFSLVYARSFRASYYIAKHGKPIVVETHTPRVTNPQLKRLIGLDKNNSFKISTISEILKSNFVDAGMLSENVIVQEDAVDISKFDKVNDNKNNLRKKLKLPLDKKIITYSGSLRKGKGIDSLIETAKLFKKNNDILFLVLGGPEQDKAYYQKKSKQLGLTNIVFAGFIYNELIPKYLKASDILIMLYSYQEKKRVMDLNTTSPIKLFEYIASKRPIIVSKVPTIEKIVENNNHVLMQEPDNIEETAKNINRILHDEHLAKELSENAYKKALQHTYKKRCENILSAF